MTAYRQCSDDSWQPATPVAGAPGYDAEVYPDGAWHLYRDVTVLVAEGRARTCLGRTFAIAKAIRLDRKAVSR